MAQISPPPGAGFAYEVAQRSLDDQLRLITALDAKAGMLLTGSGIFAGFLFSGRSFLSASPQWLLALVGFLISISLICALLSLGTQRYQSGPSTPAVARFARRDAMWLKWRFFGNMHRELDWNRRKLDKKARFLAAAQALLILAVSLVGGYFVVVEVNRWMGR